MIPNRVDNRIVIDTNVCLDLFLFRDARWDALLQALKDGRLHAVTRTDCRDEWLVVLGYDRLRIRPEARPEVAARFDALIACIPHAECPPLPVMLPVCKDKDDQKFMEIARDAGAAVLLTKDKALLKLARQTAKRGLFRIAHPERWIKDSGLAASTLAADATPEPIASAETGSPLNPPAHAPLLTAK